MPSALLISTPVISEKEKFYIPDFEIPLNICYLAAYLELQGIKTDIIDMNIADAGFDIAAFAAETKPDIVGFSAYTPFIKVAAAYAAKIKENLPGAKTAIGGYHASALPERTLEEFPSFDWLVFGEGELTLSELARAAAENKGIEGIAGAAYRNSNGAPVLNEKRARIEDIDTLPFPAREKLEQHKYKVNPINYIELPTTGILASRGCERHCTFCSQSVFSGARVRSAKNIADEIEDCAHRFGMKGFRFYDDNLTAYRETCIGFCEEIQKRGLRVNWNCFSRVDAIDEELLRTMKRAGCHQIKLGVETGTEKMLRVIAKGITLDQSRRAVAMSRAAGIETQISIILGLPGETIEEMRETISFAISLNPDLAGFNLFKPMPGSPLYKSLSKSDELAHFDWEDYSIKQSRPTLKDQLPQDVLEKMLSKAYLAFFFRPAYFIQRFKWLMKYPRRETLRFFIGMKYIIMNTFSGGGK